jgi:hypothetical protein
MRTLTGGFYYFYYLLYDLRLQMDSGVERDGHTQRPEAINAMTTY